jgi:hypothetical protein
VEPPARVDGSRKPITVRPPSYSRGVEADAQVADYLTSLDRFFDVEAMEDTEPEGPPPADLD